MLNLYGHPLAGLFWETHCKRALIACGFEPVTSWECLYEHAKDGLFLSVYVDDFKMAGRKDSLAPIWAKLGKHLELEPPTPFDENIYLGCGQSNITLPPPIIVAEKQMLYKKRFAKDVTGLFNQDASPADLSDNGTTI